MKPRILSIDLKLDNDQITNAGFIDAPSFHDFDIVLIDPLGITNFLDKQSHKYKESFRTIDYDPTGTDKWIKNVTNQRRKETKRFLNLGRLLVCILRRPDIAYLCSFPDEWPKPKEEQNWVNNYGWFPLEYKTDSMISILHLSEGSKINLSEPNHPFAPYFKTFNKELKQLHYEAHLDESQKPYYFKNFHTIAKTHGELPVAFSFDLQGGQVVFLPPIENPDPKKLAGVLLNCISATIGTIEETTAPSWISDYKVSLPNLSDLEGETEKLHKKISELQERLNTAEQQKADQQKYLKLLYEQGKFQLEPVVRDAFSLFGFTVKEAEPSDGLLESDEGAVILEVEGKDNTQISRDKYRQLLDHVDDDERQTGHPKKGILVGNAFRLKDPNERDKQFTKDAVDAAIGSHFCLLATDTLFQLVRKVLNDLENDNLKRQIRQKIMTTDGVFRFEVNQPEEENHG
ncbi:MAG: hypothetical protein FJ005_03350 [Chloroflexi bacterium]|nr:hypothetical protein [Chloroflexota bacterium]